MQTAKPTPDTRPPLSPASVKAMRLSLARSHTVMFPTRLAFARWTRGGNVPHLASQTTVPLRAAWFARAERDYQTWLEAGGFVQHDDGAPLLVLVESDDTPAGI